jgi:hypothetical protein
MKRRRFAQEKDLPHPFFRQRHMLDLEIKAGWLEGQSN